MAHQFLSGKVSIYIETDLKAITTNTHQAESDTKNYSISNTINHITQIPSGFGKNWEKYNSLEAVKGTINRNFKMISSFKYLRTDNKSLL